MAYAKERKKRDLDAEKLGEGGWHSKKTGEGFRVDVTFYPRTQLWITEGGKRRKITRKELDRDYFQLSI